MKCVFCKQSSVSSVTVEHIVPESLGNKEHVLARGIVCDKCNNYFATKVEKKVLETEFFRNLRFRTGLESKKGRVPPGNALFPKTGCNGEISFDDEASPLAINITVDKETFDAILAGDIKQTYIPLNFELPKNNQTISRMLAKIAMEFMVQKFLHEPGYVEFMVDEEGFDPLRNYARFNHKNEIWPYTVRKIYNEDEKFFRADGKSVDMVFECDFLGTELGEIYFVIAFKGIEFALNLAGPSIEGYENWLENNKGLSPLYRQGMGFGYSLTPEFLKSNQDNPM
ncbi:MAG: HNH endonuclease [Bacteroidota bacterium]